MEDEVEGQKWEATINKINIPEPKRKLCNCSLISHLLKVKFKLMLTRYWLITLLAYCFLIYLAQRYASKNALKRITYKHQTTEELFIFAFEWIFSKYEFRLKRVTISHILSSVLVFYTVLAIPGIIALQAWEFTLNDIPYYLGVYFLVCMFSTILS